MKCPACQHDMATLDVHSIEIDRCTNCGGIVLDKGESELIELLGLSVVIEQGVPTPMHLRTTPAHCYVCMREMVALMGPNDVEYDWCDNCERLFFDRGELSLIDSYVDS